VVEARGVETRRLFAPYGEPAHLFVFLNFRFSAAHTKMHCHEAFVSRPVPSKEGGGGASGIGPPAAARCICARGIFCQNTFEFWSVRLSAFLKTATATLK